MFTIVGGGGSIGSALATSLRDAGEEVLSPGRSDDLRTAGELGHVLYCIGLTADFRARPFDTVDAHVLQLRRILDEAQFSSLLYLSSTRVYRGLTAGHEDAALIVSPRDPDDLYNASKILGESLCLAQPSPAIRVVRLANVIGPGATSPTFVHALVAEALADGAIELQSDLRSTKDYVDIRDVVEILPRIAVTGRERLYNIASGRETSHQEIVRAIERETGCTVHAPAGLPLTAFPPISIERVRVEFDFAPRPLGESIVDMIRERAATAPEG